MSVKYDLAIIGSGPAGLAAAISARRAGAKKVLIIERDRELGGILLQCIHPGFGLHIFKEELTGPEYAQRFINQVEEIGIEVKLNTMALEIKDSNKETKRIIATNNKEIIEVKTRAIVLAMGCRERTRGALVIPGSRPAGIYTAGAAQRIVNMEGYLPGKNVVVLGSGDIGLIMARRFKFEGAKVKAVIEVLPYPSGLTRNVVQCLNDFKIPLYLEHTIIDIQGKEKINSVVMAKVDKRRKPILETEKKIFCDTLLLSVGLIPENELSRQIGISLDKVTGGPVVDEFCQTSIPGIFSGGNVLQVHDLVDNVTLESNIAGESAANFAAGLLPKVLKWKRVIPGEGVTYLVPQKISGEREVTLYLRVKKPQEKVSLQIRGTKISHPLPYVRPAEMVTFRLNQKRLEEIAGREEVVVSVVERAKDMGS